MYYISGIELVFVCHFSVDLFNLNLHKLAKQCCAGNFIILYTRNVLTIISFNNYVNRMFLNIYNVYGI